MTNRNPRRILMNDDGWIMSETETPLTVHDLKEKMVATYERTCVDALLWCIGDHEVYDYETEVGERFGDGCPRFDNPKHQQRRENLQSLINECGGPLTALTQLCHKSNLDIFASVRMNSHYNVEKSDPGYGRFRFEEAKVVKWNVVFRLKNPHRIQPGAYSFRTFVVVGDLKGVRRDMVRLLKEKSVPL